MSQIAQLPRQCLATSSRYTLLHPHPPRLPIRHFSILPDRQQQPQLPFFTPPFVPPSLRGSSSPGSPSGQDPHSEHDGSGGKGKGVGPEEEVDDGEWEIRAARAMLHLQESIPRFFHPGQTTSDMFPPEIFSQHLVLKLPHPLPLKTSTLTAYALVYSLARNGMQALHTDLTTSLDRMTFTPTPGDLATTPAASLLLASKPIPTRRQRQIRSLVTVKGKPRLPGNMEAVWHTSSLYTISPLSGLIISHEVESIRPLPGEGVAEWLKNRLRGWTTPESEASPIPVPCPRSTPVPSQSELLRFLESRRRERS